MTKPTQADVASPLNIVIYFLYFIYLFSYLFTHLFIYLYFLTKFSCIGLKFLARINLATSLLFLFVAPSEIESLMLK